MLFTIALLNTKLLVETKSRMKKINISLLSSVWQLTPTLASVALTLIIVKIFSVSFWGSLVSFMAVFQVAGSIVAWGNKEYLQREMTQKPSQAYLLFSSCFFERLVLLISILFIILCMSIIDKNIFIQFALLLFGRYLYQSFDVLILKEKCFIFLLKLEFILLVLQGLLLYLLYQTSHIQPFQLLPLFWIPALLKGIILSFRFKNYFRYPDFNSFHLRKSIGFSMLSISGLVHSKIDLLLFSRYLDNSSLGKYQILMALLWNIQAIAQYISSPFIPNYYRLDATAKHRMQLLLKQLGFVIVLLCVSSAFLLFKYYLNINLDWTIFIAALLFGFMSYYYIPLILDINKKKKENVMIGINLLGTLILSLSIYSIQFYFNISLSTAIYLVTFHQLFITFIIFWANKKTTHEKGTQ